MSDIDDAMDVLIDILDRFPPGCALDMRTNFAFEEPIDVVKTDVITINFVLDGGAQLFKVNRGESRWVMCEPPSVRETRSYVMGNPWWRVSVHDLRLPGPPKPGTLHGITLTPGDNPRVEWHYKPDRGG